MKARPLVYLIAGEASGDQLGGAVMEALTDLYQGQVDFAGIGGEKMQAMGLQSLFPMEELSIMGIGPILKQLPHLLGRIRQTVQDIQALQPDVVLTIDAPDFSLRVQKKVRALRSGSRPRLMHLVAPTVWVWRPGRAKKVAQYLDHLLAIYPFEPPLFEVHGLKTTFVGHPLALTTQGDGARFRAEHGIPSEATVLSLLPGSRRSEIDMAMPHFGGVINALSAEIPDLRLVIPSVSKYRARIEKMSENWSLKPTVVEGDESRRDAFAASKAALAVSGTVALQLAAAHLPLVIVYKLASIGLWVLPMSWVKALFRLKGKWVCMINILQNKQVVPELLQENCTAERMLEEIRPLLENKASPQIPEFKEVISKLLPSGCATPQIAIAHAIQDEMKLLNF